MGSVNLATDFGVLLVVSRGAARVPVSEYEKWALRLRACWRVSLAGIASLVCECLSLVI